MASDPRIPDMDIWAPVRCRRCGRFMKVVGYEGEHLDGEPIWRCSNTRHLPAPSTPEQPEGENR